MGWTVAAIRRDIRLRYAEAKSSADDVIDPAWIVQAVMADHGADVHGDDAEFVICAAHDRVSLIVDELVRKDKQKDADPTTEQLPLPGDGFEHLQPWYTLERDGSTLIVKLTAMTDEEIQAKADEQRAMGRGCFAHADELIRYMENRRG